MNDKWIDIISSILEKEISGKEKIEPPRLAMSLGDSGLEEIIKKYNEFMLLGSRDADIRSVEYNCGWLRFCVDDAVEDVSIDGFDLTISRDIKTNHIVQINIENTHRINFSEVSSKKFSVRSVTNTSDFTNSVYRMLTDIYAYRLGVNSASLDVHKKNILLDNVYDIVFNDNVEYMVREYEYEDTYMYDKVQKAITIDDNVIVLHKGDGYTYLVHTPNDMDMVPKPKRCIFKFYTIMELYVEAMDRINWDGESIDILCAPDVSILNDVFTIETLGVKVKVTNKFTNISVEFTIADTKNAKVEVLNKIVPFRNKGQMVTYCRGERV